MFAYQLLSQFKNYLEKSILENGEKGFSDMIRSQKPINYIHEIIKHDLIKMASRKVIYFRRCIAQSQKSN